MDVERIQKINALALDLMKRGLAADREEAVIQAERVYRSRDAQESYSALRETMAGIQEDTQKVRQGGSSETIALNDNTVKEILEKNTEFIVSKMKEFQDKIAAFEKEISQLKTQMTHHRPAMSQEMPASRPAPASSGMVGKDPSSSNHPRSGNYNANDVSIEKFFYMGSK